MALIAPRPIPPELRADYEQFLAGERQRGAREIATLSLVLYLLFGILDIWAIPSALYEIWGIRLAVSALIAAFYRLSYRPFFLRYYAPLILGFFIMLGLGIELMVYFASDADLARQVYYTGLILVLIALHTWPSLPAWLNAATGALLILIYLGIALAIHDLPLSASIGVAYYPENACSAEELIRTADLQMYEAKKSGKGRVSIVDAGLVQR